jgi:hypothetical protein
MDDLMKVTLRKNSVLLASRLTNELLDENLMQKYGTSIHINMGREYQKYLDKKLHDLGMEFKKINRNDDDNISLEELTEFVNSYENETGRRYDESYSRKLFNILDKNSDEKLTIQEFIESYIKLEEKLRLKKIKITKLYEELISDEKKFSKGMIENKGERISSEGIADNATLTVSLYDAKDLKTMGYSGSSNPYVIFILDGKKETSNYKTDTLEPVWNENFIFSVSRRDLVLEGQVWCRNSFGRESLHGKIRIPLRDLMDQLRIEKEIELFNEEGSSDNGSIRLRLHYIYSKYKYFADNYQITVDKMNLITEDIQILNQYVELFEKPFGILLSGEIENIFSRNFLHDDHYLQPTTSIRRSVYMASPRFTTFKGFTNRLEKVVKNISSILFIKLKIKERWSGQNYL